ncbi:BURP domain-containing protein 11 isoform X9 [Oryza sativa Japonica Group]|uniref:BURP domain-containing protein 11 isoform X9 n=1 Tax=Oryza sativa subsp. japonica TaxID=39947 RepID=UPI000E1C2BD1|nr:BURP domain-containing protein 11 isoform X10 [Oryza sativa Japonica Group]
MASSEIHIPSTHVMDVLVLLISLILLIGGSSGANMAVAVTKPSPTAMEYWQKKFPETPMPPAILDLLTPLPTAAEGLKEVSVSYGSEGKEEPKKAFPMGRYMLDKEREMTSCIDKAGLKEVSMTYGSDGEEEPRKTFSQVGYMLDKERKKSSDVDEDGLKEVSVSYGSNGEEETSKTFAMGGFMADKECEMSLQGEKEGLKEVSVSYGPEDEDKKSKVFPAKNWSNNEYEKYLHKSEATEGLKEVSVSYGSEGKEEPRKAFPMGQYMLDKEREMTSHTDKDGLREVSVSYGSKGEVVTRKAFPMERYVLDKEPKRNLHRNKDELREVSVLYGSKGKLKNLFPTGYGHKKHKHANEADLKEVSVSYGSNDEEKPRKAFLRGGLFLGNEYEKSVHIDKEDLKEVSVSYGSNVKLSNLFPTGYAHQKYILTSGAGLKEVSVTYGSDGEEEPRKTFSKVGYMLDKECKKSSDVDEGMDHGRHVHAHGNKMQQLADVFFFRDALRPGSVITPTIPPTTSLPAFLPRHVADAIPFSADRFADVLAMFAPASLAMAREIRWALDTCGQRAAALLPGEKAGCATSLESLADLAASLLGTRDVRAFSAADLPTDAATTPARRGRYNVTSVRELSAMAGSGSSSSSEPAPAAVVACHDLTYPYAVFYCHSTKPTAAYAVTLVAATTGDGDGEGEAASPAKMEALAVCHLDTSRWRADNPFFVAHGVKPGEVSVCHFLTKLSIVWVPRHEQGGPRAAA